MDLLHQPLLLFLALFALYSPLAAVPSYFPVVGALSPADLRRLAVGLFLNVAVFGLVALWVGEPLLELLGVSTAALTATGGVALFFEGLALMRGTAHPMPEPVNSGEEGDGSTFPAGQAVSAAVAGEGQPAVLAAGGSLATAELEAPTKETWRESLFVPVTFPLTVGGTTFAFFVAFRADAGPISDVLLLSVAAVAYAAVTGTTIYASGHVHRRASPATASFLDRIAGILLTAIALTILTSGLTRLVVDVLDGLRG